MLPYQVILLKYRKCLASGCSKWLTIRQSVCFVGTALTWCEGMWQQNEGHLHAFNALHTKNSFRIASVIVLSKRYFTTHKFPLFLFQIINHFNFCTWCLLSWRANAREFPSIYRHTKADNNEFNGFSSSPCCYSFVSHCCYSHNKHFNLR